MGLRERLNEELQKSSDMVGNTASITPEQEEAIQREIEAASKKPLVVVVMGQTGVGKSSLINALFGTQMPVDPVRPCTSQPEPHDEPSPDGLQLLRFWDMPGIGESSSADTKHIHEYRRKIVEADIALWLCHADSRSVTLEVEAMHKILASLPEDEQTTVVSKLTFALTKADLIKLAPWIAQKSHDQAVFIPHPKTMTLLDEKAQYYKETLIKPFGDKFVSRTFHDGGFDLQTERLTYDEHFAYYSGVMRSSDLDDLKSTYPKYTPVFERLYQNSEVVYCSSHFKYNLAKLMRSIVDKIGGEASIRFSHFTSPHALNRVPWARARKFSNLIVFDADKDEILFDLAGEVQQ